MLLAPKLMSNNLKPGMGSSHVIGASSSILNLPVLGQENMLQPTNRGMNGIESNKQFFRGEDHKVSGSYDSPPGLNLANRNISTYSNSKN